MKRAFLIISLSIFCFKTIEAKPISVALFYPRSEVFWDRLVFLAEAAATDLDMKIKTINGKDNHISMLNLLSNMLKNDKPDVVVFNNFKHIAAKFIELTNQAKVYSFLINSDLYPKDKERIGAPRDLYPFWIGQMLPGEETAGIEIANMLFKKVKNIVAINGVRGTGAAIMRESALKKALTNSDVNLKQVFYTNQWSREPSAILTERMFRRYPNVQGIWTANFSLALGAMDGVEKLGRNPGKDIYVTGYDIPKQILENIKNKKILATTGGHFIEGAWAMVIIHDYFNQLKTPLKMKTPMAIVTKDNVELYLKKVTNEKLTRENAKKINFKQYSKKYNKKKSYNFDLDSILEQL